MGKYSPHRIENYGKTEFFSHPSKNDIVGMVMGNPMILLMGVSFLLVMIMPKMADMNDPEVKKQMEESMSMFKGGGGKDQAQMPDLAETMMNMFGKPKPTTKYNSKKKK